MNKRNSILTDFESVYLRSNCARKAFSKTEQVKRLMKQPFFEKGVRYIAKISFRNNKELLLSHGFALEDLTNIIRVFALESLNYEFKSGNQKDDHYIFMKYIQGKLHSFYLSVGRKFHTKESHLEMRLPSYETLEASKDHTYNPHENTDPGVFISQRTISKKYKPFKKELYDNIQQYSDRLAELATSKITDFQARKKARSICKLHGIDYTAWAMKQILNNKLDRHDLILE